MKDNKNFMISSEIADLVEESQFGNNDEDLEVNDHIVLNIESDKFSIPGILIRHEHKKDSLGSDEEFLFSFLTDQKNIHSFLKSNFSKASLSLGAETIAEYDIEGMEIKRFAIEQTPMQSGCVITIVYR
jgi:hypothetical protein